MVEEPESAQAQSQRRMRRIRHVAAELVIAAAFVGGAFVADNVSADAAAPPALKAAALAAPVVILTIWWTFYIFHIRSLDELERSIETRAMAIGCAVTIWITTVWGLLALFAGAPVLPLIFVAPLAGGIYGAIRLIVALRYR